MSTLNYFRLKKKNLIHRLHIELVLYPNRLIGSLLIAFLSITVNMDKKFVQYFEMLHKLFIFFMVSFFKKINFNQKTKNSN